MPEEKRPQGSAALAQLGLPRLRAASARRKDLRPSMDVVQKVLGHASLHTTTIYVQARKAARGRRGGSLLCRRRHA